MSAPVMIKGTERNRDLALSRNLLHGRSISPSHIKYDTKSTINEADSNVQHRSSCTEIPASQCIVKDIRVVLNYDSNCGVLILV
jgi:hypothetical protein